MPNVLLIADSPRVKKIFEAVDATGVIQLRTALTLAQGDQEIAASLPAVTFIQSRISGVSGSIVLQHLRKMLPKRARLVLLTGDADEAEAALRRGEPVLDLSLEDGELIAAVNNAISGVFAPPAPVRKNQPKTEEGLPVGDSMAESMEERVVPGGHTGRPALSEPLAAIPQPAAVDESGPTMHEERVTLRSTKAQLIEPEQDAPVPSGAAEPAPSPSRLDFREVLEGKEQVVTEEDLTAPPGSTFTYGKSLADALRCAEQQKRRKWKVQLVFGGIAAAVIFFIALRSGHKDVPPVPKALPGPGAELAAPVTTGKPAISPGTSPASKTPVTPSPKVQTAVHPTPAPKAATGSPAAHAAAVVATTPAKGPVGPAAPATAKTPQAPAAAHAPAGSAAQKVPAAGTSPHRPAQTPPPTAAMMKPAVPAASQRASVQPKPAGLVTLPQVVASARKDPAYGKSHPGWEKYDGSGAEFKVFREGGAIKALQVIAKGESLTQPLYQRVLQEFAGIDGYRVQSRGVQEKYLVERGEGAGGVGVTVYRKKSDRLIKGLVLYFR